MNIEIKFVLFYLVYMFSTYLFNDSILVLSIIVFSKLFVSYIALLWRFNELNEFFYVWLL